MGGGIVMIIYFLILLAFLVPLIVVPFLIIYLVRKHKKMDNDYPYKDNNVYH